MKTKEEIKRLLETMTEDQMNVVADGLIGLFEAIEKPAEPEIGDRCIFWDNNPHVYAVGTLQEIDPDDDPRIYRGQGIGWRKNARLLTREAE